MNKLLRYNSFIIVFLGLSIYGFSQISHGGAPISFDQNFTNLLKANVPTMTMPMVEVEKLKAEDLENDLRKDIPWRFGQNIPVNYNLSNSGMWDYLPNGSRIWRLRIYSPGALSINLIFDNYRLPAGATLFIYNQNHSHVIGSFTNANNRADKVFATTLINGDAITIEYFEPANPEFIGELSLTNVTHGYRGPADFAEKAFGNSGSCNVNVACPQSAGWENQIRSACMLVSGGSGFCSGALINNTNNDGTPYVLTADHCYSNPSSWVFWFNWQSPTCSNPGSSPSYQSISGAVLRARNAASDFCLVEMNSTPPSNYNVYYSGWNRTLDQNIAGTVWGIHHPSGDIKKISWSTLGSSTTTYLQNPVPGDGTHWRITTWSDGTTTEGGSSGSPLYDPNHRIIGQLHGGYASCSSITSDWYGKLGVSWTGGGTSATMLQPWLDPAGTNPMVIDGFDPNTPATSLDAAMNGILEPINSYCGPQNVTPAIIIRNYGSTALTSLTASYNFDGGTNVVYNWTGNLVTYQSDTIYFPAVLTTPGTHIMHTLITSPNAGIDENPNNDTSSVVFVVGSLSAPTATGAQSCTPGSLTLNATGTGELHWFDAPAGGNDLGTGNTFITPVLSTTTTYYVESVIPASPVYGAKPDNSGGGGNLTNQNQYLIFDCYTPITIVSVDVYASATGNRTFELRNSSGTVLQSATVNITSTSGAFNVPLNFSVPVGTNLQLGLASTSTCNLYRNNAGVSYPYTSAGLFSVTNSSAGNTFYYYLYNWEVVEPSCISGRTPVVATINTQVTPTISITASTTNICPGDTVTITANATNQGITPTYQWQLNGVNVGPNTSSVTTNQLTDNDVITCLLISSESCVSQDTVISNTITISAGVNPVAGFNYTSNQLDFNFTNLSSGANSYLWDFGDGTTSTIQNPTHSYSSPGMYTVTLTVTNNCGTATIIQSVNAVDNSISQITQLLSIYIYPNPTQGMVNIYFNDAIGNSILSVENTLGEKVYQTNIDQQKDSQFSFDLSSYSEGIYLIRISNNNLNIIQKILYHK